MEPCSDRLEVAEFMRPVTPPPVTSTPTRVPPPGWSPDGSHATSRSADPDELCLLCAGCRADEAPQDCNTTDRLADEIFQVYR